jgi:hypothetical protein
VHTSGGLILSNIGGRVLGKGKLFFYLWLFVVFIVDGGCHFQKSIVVHTTQQSHINRLAIIGFHSAMSIDEQPDVVRCPLSGSVFMAEPVPHDVVQKMTDVLFDKVMAKKGYESISPAKAKQVFSSSIHSDKNLRIKPLEIIKEIGAALEADGILVGYIYRWREREGTDYAVNRSASVAFDLHLIDTAGGTILWRAKFDKTQRSLSENVFDLKTFFASQGRWMTVENLAMLGLRKMLKEMPAGKGRVIPREQIGEEGP